MNKKEIINNNRCIGYCHISNCIGLELYHIEQSLDPYLYIKFGTDNKVSYHRRRLYTNSNGEDYFYIGKMKIMFSDILRI